MPYRCPAYQSKGSPSAAGRAKEATWGTRERIRSARRQARAPIFSTPLVYSGLKSTQYSMSALRNQQWAWSAFSVAFGTKL